MASVSLLAVALLCIPFEPYRYGQSKTGNILFAVEFTKRYKSQGIVANSLHPGSITTELQRHLNIQLPFS